MEKPDILFQNLLYTSFYCEENIYKLIEKLSDSINGNTYAVIITNEEKQVKIEQQKLGNATDNYSVVWDYHVIMVGRFNFDNKLYIYDFDSVLDFPIEFEKYVKLVFTPTNFKPRFFRVIPGENYLKYFASDRRHMLRNGQWMAEPPSYPCIKGRDQESIHNLNLYLDINWNDNKFGTVLDQNDFVKYFEFQ